MYETEQANAKMSYQHQGYGQTGFAQDETTVANNIGVLTAGYVSTSAVTFTGPNTNTDHVFRF